MHFLFKSLGWSQNDPLLWAYTNNDELMTTESYFNTFTCKRTENVFNHIFTFYLSLFIARKNQPRLIFDFWVYNLHLQSYFTIQNKNDTFSQEILLYVIAFKASVLLTGFPFSDFNSELPQGFWAGILDFIYFATNAQCKMLIKLAKLKVWLSNTINN